MGNPPERARQAASELASERFAPDESPSFDRRLTPVVPAAWPTEAPTSPGIASVTEEPASTTSGPLRALATLEKESTRPAADGSSMTATSPKMPTVEATDIADATAVTPSQRNISISLAPSPASDSFFETPPKYSLPPPSFSEPPLPKPSRRRSLATKLLFVVAIFAAVTLLCYEVSIAYRVPWLDPRWIIDRIRFG